CVASYHHDIVARRSYIYKVIEPERATLEIRIQSSGHHLGQVKLACNKMPSKETLDSISTWIKSRKTTY
ncbi:MAG: PcfJ domain-containing protein, partial [Sulfurovaceae bacterium]|nr:PcfJ domain-containing protein [Sulfurovaceae bacterium]